MTSILTFCVHKKEKLNGQQIERTHIELVQTHTNIDSNLILDCKIKVLDAAIIGTRLFFFGDTSFSRYPFPKKLHLLSLNKSKSFSMGTVLNDERGHIIGPTYSDNGDKLKGFNDTDLVFVELISSKYVLHYDIKVGDNKTLILNKFFSKIPASTNSIDTISFDAGFLTNGSMLIFKDNKLIKYVFENYPD